jgi:hypothetical protein
MRSGSLVNAIGFVVVLGCAHGATQQQGAQQAPSATAANEPDAQKVIVSERYGYEWRLPDDWEFVPLEEIGLASHPGIDAVVASRADEPPAALLLVARDVVAVIPGKDPATDADTLARLEADASEEMKSEGIRKTGAERLRMFDTDAVRVDGVEETEKSQISVVAFYRNRRRFTLRCIAMGGSPWTPCASALRGLVIHEVRDAPEPGDRPRVLHLRDAERGIQFDAPDDGWLAVGPRTGGQGHQLVWIWVKDGRQIDVQVMDLANVADAIDEKAFVAGIADVHRKPGTVVTVKSSVLSRLPCHHIEVRRSQGHQQDLFLQKRGNMVYGLLVTAPEHDQKLIDQAKAGIRISTP